MHNASIQESTEYQKRKAQRIYQRSLERKGARKKRKKVSMQLTPLLLSLQYFHNWPCLWEKMQAGRHLPHDSSRVLIYYNLPDLSHKSKTSDPWQETLENTRKNYRSWTYQQYPTNLNLQCFHPQPHWRWNCQKQLAHNPVPQHIVHESRKLQSTHLKTILTYQQNNVKKEKKKRYKWRIIITITMTTRTLYKKSSKGKQKVMHLHILISQIIQLCGFVKVFIYPRMRNQ